MSISAANTYIETLKKTLDRIDRKEVVKFIDLLMEARKSRRRIFVCGNGGSAMTASHFAGDINKGVSYGLGLEPRFKVISLVDSLAMVTAYSNDVNYNSVFVEQLKNFLEPGDLVIGFSGSGNSENILRAISYANDNGAVSIGMTGYDGGKLRKLATYSVNANVDDMQIAEDVHMALVHMTFRLLSERLRGG